MKKKILVSLIGVSIICSLAGCGKKKATTTEVATSTDVIATVTEATTEATEAEAEELKIIGEEAVGGYSVILTNETKQDIVSVRVYDSVSDEFCDNMLLDDDVFVEGEKRILYYENKTDEASEGSESDKLISVGYDVEITLEDETVYVLHGFPFGVIAEGSVFVEDEVAFLCYDEYSTKEAELAIKESQDIDSVTEPVQNNTNNQNYDSSTDVSDPAPSEPAPVADPEPAPSEPAPVAEPEPAPAEPSVDQGAEDCIGDDGLTY